MAEPIWKQGLTNNTQTITQTSSPIWKQGLAVSQTVNPFDVQKKVETKNKAIEELNKLVEEPSVAKIAAKEYFKPVVNFGKEVLGTLGGVFDFVTRTGQQVVSGLGTVTTGLTQTAAKKLGEQSLKDVSYDDIWKNEVEKFTDRAIDIGRPDEYFRAKITNTPYQENRLFMDRVEELARSSIKKTEEGNVAGGLADTAKMAGYAFIRDWANPFFLFSIKGVAKGSFQYTPQEKLVWQTEINPAKKDFLIGKEQKVKEVERVFKIDTKQAGIIEQTKTGGIKAQKAPDLKMYVKQQTNGTINVKITNSGGPILDPDIMKAVQTEAGKASPEWMQRFQVKPPATSVETLNILDDLKLDPNLVKSRLNDIATKIDRIVTGRTTLSVDTVTPITKEINKINPNNFDSPGAFYREVSNVLKKLNISSSAAKEALKATTQDFFILGKASEETAKTGYKAADLLIGYVPVKEVGVIPTKNVSEIVNAAKGLVQNISSVKDYLKIRGLDPKSVLIKDNKNFIVKNTAGNDAVLVDVPIESFGKPKIETQIQQKGLEESKTIAPIEATLKDKKIVITDGIPKYAQAIANGDKTIPTVLEVYKNNKVAVEKEIRELLKTEIPEVAEINFPISNELPVTPVRSTSPVSTKDVQVPELAAESSKIQAPIEKQVVGNILRNNGSGFDKLPASLRKALESNEKTIEINTGGLSKSMYSAQPTKKITASEFINRLARTNPEFAKNPSLTVEGGDLVHRVGNRITRIKKELLGFSEPLPDGMEIKFEPHKKALSGEVKASIDMKNFAEETLNKYYDCN